MAPYAALKCPIHGQVFISQKEYQQAAPNALWTCPHAYNDQGWPVLCGEACEFDDAYWEAKE